MSARRTRQLTLALGLLALASPALALPWADAEWPKRVRIGEVRLSAPDGGAPFVRMQAVTLAPGSGGSSRVRARLLFPGLVPLGLEAELSRGGTEPRLRGRLLMPHPDGEVRFALGGGAERLALDAEARLRFRPGGLQPQAIVPAWAGRVREASGQILAVARIERGGRRMEAAELQLRDLTFRVGDLRIEGLEGTVLFDRLWPPRTLPGQRLRLRRAEIGLAAEEVELSFRLDDGLKLRLSALRASLLGGSARVEPADISLRDPQGRWRIVFSDLDLAALLSAIAVPGLAGQGRVEGWVRLVRREGALEIEDARLVAARPGVLRYRPDSLPASPELVLLTRALAHFRYRTLEARLSGPLLGEMRLSVRLEGANPDFEGGQPFVLNLAFEGPFGRIVRAGFKGFEVARQVRRRLEAPAP